MTTAQKAGAIAAAIAIVGAAVIAGVRYSGARAPLVPAPVVRPESSWVARVDTLHAGEPLSAALARAGVRGANALRVLAAAAPAVSERKAPAGMLITSKRHTQDSVPREIAFRLDVDRLMRVSRTGDTLWIGAEERLPWKSDTIAVHGVIRANLYQALDDSASPLLAKDARTQLAWTLADIYEYRVDMSRELQKGDDLRALVVRETAPTGAQRIATILAARFTLSGSPIEAIRFADAAGRVEYYDATDRSLRAAFLRAPLSFRRVSSGYGTRFHPILQIWRKHAGIDYAADAGTPVRAIGDGTVTFAGKRGGYGNLVEIRHRNGFISRYGHLRGFATGIHAGKPVTIGQTIAYVGQTGLATGPHLHFELLVNGAQRDPRSALAHSESAEIPSASREEFARQRAASLAILDGAAHTPPPPPAAPPAH